LRVVEKPEGGLEIERAFELLREPRFGLLDLGPRRIQQMVRKAVNTRFHAGDGAAAIGKKEERRRIPDEKAEAVVVHRTLLDPLEVFQWSHFPCQEIAHQRAAGGRAGFLVRGISVVRERGESPIQGYAEPGATGLEIAPGEDVRMLVPEPGGRSRPPEILVAVCGNDQTIARVPPPCEYDQAHRV